MDLNDLFESSNFELSLLQIDISDVPINQLL